MKHDTKMKSVGEDVWVTAAQFFFFFFENRCFFVIVEISLV